MTRFQCIPIPAETASRFRATGVDDQGNELRRIEAHNGSSLVGASFPCRRCLRPAQAGEMMLLGSYDLPRPRGIYWTPSPVFLHERDCAPFDAADTVAPIVALNPLISVRAYDQADQCLYDLGQVCAGADVAEPLDRALSDLRTAFVNIHTARPGCLLCRVETVPQHALA